MGCPRRKRQDRKEVTIRVCRDGFLGNMGYSFAFLLSRSLSLEQERYG
jgi:hypothetical protein